jgi:hypothetical protein
MTTLSPQMLDAIRSNAQTNAGPRSPEGKNRWRLNALKHGATAQIPVLPGEDPSVFHARLDAYRADVQPRNTLENDLVERMAVLSMQFDRATRVHVARMTSNVLTMPDAARRALELEAEALGQRLFYDRRGPLAAYPTISYVFHRRTSWSGIPDDPDDPSRLVKQLEITGPGSRWLLERWAELRARLEDGQCWQSPDKLKAIRLLGRQPLDAADVREVAEVFLASHVLDPRHKHAFFELTCELDDLDFRQYEKRLRGRNVDAMRPATPADARAMLLRLVNGAMDQLRPLAEANRIRDEQAAALTPELVAFDDSQVGDRLRRHAVASDRGLHRALATILKLRDDAETEDSEPVHPVHTALEPATAAAKGLEIEPALAIDQALQNEPIGGDQKLQNERNRGEEAFSDESTSICARADRASDEMARLSGGPSSDLSPPHSAFLQGPHTSRRSPSDRVEVLEPLARLCAPLGGLDQGESLHLAVDLQSQLAAADDGRCDADVSRRPVG